MSEKNSGKPIEETRRISDAEWEYLRQQFVEGNAADPTATRIAMRLRPTIAEVLGDAVYRRTAAWALDLQEARSYRAARGELLPEEAWVPRLHVRGIDGEVFVVPVSGRLAWLARAWRCV